MGKDGRRRGCPSAWNLPLHGRDNAAFPGAQTLGRAAWPCPHRALPTQAGRVEPRAGVRARAVAPRQIRLGCRHVCSRICPHSRFRFGRPRLRRGSGGAARPARFVASIYADGREDAVWTQWLDRARRGEWFSRALTALWSRCDARARKDNNKLGALDFDVATNSQGLEVKRFTVKTLSGDASHASVVTKLAPDNWARKSDHENEIRYELVWESGRWAIDDIHSVIEPKPWSLRTILTQYLAR